LYCPVLYYYGVHLRMHLSTESPTLNQENIERLIYLKLQQEASLSKGERADRTVVRQRVHYCCALIRPLLLRSGGMSSRPGDGAVGFTMDGLLGAAEEELDNRTYCLGCLGAFLKEVYENVHVDKTEIMMVGGVGSEQMKEMRLQRRANIITHAEGLVSQAQRFMAGQEQQAGQIGTDTFELLKTLSLAPEQLMYFAYRLTEAGNHGTT
jgi:hypothetical protein